MSIADLQGVLDNSLKVASTFTRDLITDRGFSAEEVADLVNAAGGITVATVSQAGVPHAALVVALCVDGTIVFTSNRESVVERNLTREPRIAVTCSVKGQGGLMGQGLARRLGSYDERSELHDAFGARLSGWDGLLYAFEPRRLFASQS